MSTVHLEANQVPAHLQRIGGYSGRKYKARVCEAMTIPETAGLWDGGSRDVYRIVRLADGREVHAVNHNAAPWDGRRAYRVELEPGYAVVEHSMFCGKDMGLTFHMHAADAAPMLPAKVELTPCEAIVLEYTAGRKSSYMGRDRFEQYRDDMRWREHAQAFTRDEWNAAKLALFNRGYLNKAGAITPAGRNARPSRY